LGAYGIQVASSQDYAREVVVRSVVPRVLRYVIRGFSRRPTEGIGDSRVCPEIRFAVFDVSHRMARTQLFWNGFPRSRLSAWE
jgi:hypothetical protein